MQKVQQVQKILKIKKVQKVQKVQTVQKLQKFQKLQKLLHFLFFPASFSIIQFLSVFHFFFLKVFPFVNVSAISPIFYSLFYKFNSRSLALIAFALFLIVLQNHCNTLPPKLLGGFHKIL